MLRVGDRGSAGRDAHAPVLAALDRLVFRDRAGCLARAAHDLGDAYRETGVLLHNASALSRILLLPADKPLPKEGAWEGLTAVGLAAAAAAVGRAESVLAEARPECAESARLLAEFRQMAAMMRHACRQGSARLASPDGCLVSADPATRRALAAELESLIAEQRRLWLARNREGGLAESLRPLEVCRAALLR